MHEALLMENGRVVLYVWVSDYGRYLPPAAQHEECTDADKIIEMQDEMSGFLIGKVI